MTTKKGFCDVGHPSTVVLHLNLWMGALCRIPRSTAWAMCCAIFERSCLQYCLNHRLLLDNVGCSLYFIRWHLQDRLRDAEKE